MFCGFRGTPLVLKLPFGAELFYFCCKVYCSHYLSIECQISIPCKMCLQLPDHSSCLSVLQIVRSSETEVIIYCNHPVSVTKREQVCSDLFPTVKLGFQEIAESPSIVDYYALCTPHTFLCMRSTGHSCLGGRHTFLLISIMPLFPGVGSVSVSCCQVLNLLGLLPNPLYTKSCHAHIAHPSPGSR